MADLVVILTIGSEAFVPLVAHHILSFSAMLIVALAIPNAVWYACLLQCSEFTIPIQFTVWLLEQYGRRGTTAYTVARWLQLVAWLLMRITLFLVFGFVVWRDFHALYAPVPKTLALVTGPALLAFNCGGLVKVVLPGWPWLPTTGGGGAKRR